MTFSKFITKTSIICHSRDKDKSNDTIYIHPAHKGTYLHQKNMKKCEYKMLQIQPLPRLLNERSNISLIANVSKVAPSCILTWYFATKEYLASFDEEHECDDCKVGRVKIFEPIKIFLPKIIGF